MNKRFRKRSWGWWLVLLDRKHFKVKLLKFKAAGNLSLQYHSFRHELWIFLSGKGTMQTSKDGDGFPIESGHYYHATLGDLHRFKANKATWVLEVQYGEKCIEEDIVRV